MKKITFLLGAFLLTSFFYQASAQARDISTILNEYNALKNSPLSEMMVINQNFNEADRAVLLNYFADQRAKADFSNNIFTSESVPSEFYVLNVRGDDNFGTLDGAPPFDAINSIVNPYSITCFADDFARDGDYYALEYFEDVTSSRTIVSIDPSDGAITTIGDYGAITGNAVPNGMAYDFTTETMYVTAANVLYTLDLGTGDLTAVGPMNTTTGIWLVIDNDGNGYVADISDDNFSSIDLSTGTTSVIGPLGVDISFAQEATIDPEDNTLYMAAYTGGGGGGIYTVDVATGAATLVGDTTPLNAEFGMFSVGGEPALGVNDNQLNSLTISPNPASGGMVEITSPLAGEKAVAVYDVTGKIVIQTVVDNTLDVSGLSAGVYMVRINQNQSSVTKKLIIN